MPLWEPKDRMGCALCLATPWGEVVPMAKQSSCSEGDQVPSLGWEDPLEKGMATHSSILAWEIPRTEESGGLLSMGSQRVGSN